MYIEWRGMIILNKKDMAKIFAAAAAVGAAAATAAIVVNRNNKKRAAEEIKSLPKGKNIYFIGNSVPALFAAAYLIHDFGFKGDSIHIFGKYPISGCGNNEDGFINFDYGIIAAQNSKCLFDILEKVPSRDIADISVKTEIENYNNAYPLSSSGRLYGSKEKNLSAKDKKQILKLMRSEKDETLTMGDIFSGEFFLSDFYIMWQSIFGLDRDTSASEFRKIMREFLFLSPEVETCTGLMDTYINRHECIIEPLISYLEGCGVEFNDNITVTDLEFDNENQNVSAIHIVDKGTQKIFYLNTGDLCFMTPCSIYEAMTAGDFNTPAPAYQSQKCELWNILFTKCDGIGDPSMLEESPVITFTATLKSDILSSKIFDKTINSPGTLLTVRNSNWDLSLTCPMNSYFDGQDDDNVHTIFGRILNCGTEGNYVKKHAINASGAEILYELVCLLGMENEWEEIRDDVINVIPVLMPFGKSASSIKNQNAKAPAFPADIKNFAMLGEFTNTNKACGDMEFYAYTAKNAVYTMLGKKHTNPHSKIPFLPGLKLIIR